MTSRGDRIRIARQRKFMLEYVERKYPKRITPQEARIELARQKKPLSTRIPKSSQKESKLKHNPSGNIFLGVLFGGFAGFIGTNTLAQTEHLSNGEFLGFFGGIGVVTALLMSVYLEGNAREKLWARVLWDKKQLATNTVKEEVNSFEIAWGETQRSLRARGHDVNNIPRWKRTEPQRDYIQMEDKLWDAMVAWWKEYEAWDSTGRAKGREKYLVKCQRMVEMLAPDNFGSILTHRNLWYSASELEQSIVDCVRALLADLETDFGISQSNKELELKAVTTGGKSKEVLALEKQIMGFHGESKSSSPLSFWDDFNVRAE